MPERFDVFVSYHWRDQREVTMLAEKLHERGLEVFFDRWYLPSGRPWQQELERVLASCRAVVVCIGPGEMGPWQTREQNFALERQAIDRTFSVIPLLLPKAAQPQGFIRQNTWIDMSAGINQPLMLDTLQRAIRGEPPGPEFTKRLKELLSCISPYKGLAYFREEDAPIFFGRQQAITTLVDAVNKRNFVAMVGSSGSGKSSVVRAGLIPQLYKEKERPWEIITIVPNDRPLYNLAAALVPLLDPKLGETDRLVQISKLAGALTSGTLKLRDVIQRVLEKQPGTTRIMLIVDQWEELYTLTRNNDERRRFIDELLAATAGPPLSVVLTLRGDYVDDALAYRPLSDRLQGAQVNLGPMDRVELHEAIEQPAHAVDADFEPNLVEVILDDVGDEPGNLPLLSLVLQKLWEDARLHGSRLRHYAYKEMGRLQGALVNSAEATYLHLSEPEQQTARRVFLQLVQPSQKGEETRRRATLDELDDWTRTVVTRLTKERLIVMDHDRSEITDTVELAHEALIRHWPRLKDWLDQDRTFLQWRERMRASQNDWLRTNHDKEALLHGPLLSDGEHWLAQGKGSELADDERNYVTQSVTARDRRERKQFRKLVGTVIGSVLVVIFVSTLASFWKKEKERADQRLKEAREVAGQVVFTLEHDLQPIAGADKVRQRLLDITNDMMTRLREGGAEDPDSLYTQGAALVQRGNLAMSHDNLSLAREFYNQAHMIIERLTQTNPGNKFWQGDLAVSYAKLGEVEATGGDLETALIDYQKSLKIREELSKADPSNRERQRDLAISYAQLGDMEWKAGKLDAARSAYSTSVRNFEHLTQVEPGNNQWQAGLGISYIKQADVEHAAGQLETARMLYRESLTTFERLVRDNPVNSEWQRDLAVCYGKLGDLEIDAGQLDAARSAFNETLTIFEHLTQAEQTNNQWQRDLANSHEKLGDVERAAKRMEAAHTEYKRNLEIRVLLAEKDPSNVALQKEILQNYWKLLMVIPSGDCEADRRLTAAEKILADFDQTKALKGDAQMPMIRNFFRQYRAEQGDAPCSEGRVRNAE